MSYNESEKLVTGLLQEVANRNERLGIKDIPEGFQLPLNELIRSFISDSKDLVSHGEPGIAFENILENLYEVDFKIDKKILELSKKAAGSFGFDWSKWQYIEELVS